MWLNIRRSADNLMNTPPPVPDHKYESILGQIRLLRILYFVMAGLSIIGILFIIGHYALMSHLMSIAAKAPQNPNQPPFNPTEFFSIFKWLYLLFGLLIITGGILNTIVAICLGRRKSRTFCLVVAAGNCLHFPFGTALGVFSLITLMKPEAELAFSNNKES